MKIDEKQVKNLMENLDLTREEALQVIADDNAIDHGEKLFELTAEQKAVEKKSRSTGTKTVYTFTKRERKPNETKGFLIENLAKFLENPELNTENVQIVNKERLISFKIGENDFEITLTQKRKAKK